MKYFEDHEEDDDVEDNIHGDGVVDDDVTLPNLQPGFKIFSPNLLLVQIKTSKLDLSWMFVALD